MSKTKKLGIVATVVAAVLVLVMAMETSASYAWEIPDSSGNVLADSETTSINCEKDYYWFGSDLTTTEDVKIGYDAIMAGKDITLNGGAIAGSLRAAGKDIKISGTQIGRNITVAGKDIYIDPYTTFDGGYIAGKAITYNGTSTGLTLAGKDVVIDGTIRGEVKVYADTLKFGDNAYVTGQVIGEVGSQPVVSNLADVPNLNVTVDVDEHKDSSHSKAFVNFSVGWGWKLFSFFATLVIGVFMCLVMKKPLASSGAMLKAHPVAMPITGLVSLVAVPIALVILMITVIGIPISLILLTLYVLILVTAVAFAGTSAGQLVFPKWNRWGSSMVGVAAVALVAAIPFVGWIVKLAAMIYALGYFILLAFFQIGKEKK